MIRERAWLLMVCVLMLCLRYARAETAFQHFETSKFDSHLSVRNGDVEADVVSNLAKRSRSQVPSPQRASRSLTRSHSAPGSLSRESTPVSSLDDETINTTRRQPNAPQHQSTAGPSTNPQQRRRWQPDRIITTTAGPSRSMVSANRGRTVYRDLVRSASPSPPRVQMPPRASSSSPTWYRRIDKVVHRYAHPMDTAPAATTVSMLGPGIISHQLPNNRRLQTVVPARSMALRHINHSLLSVVGAQTLPRGSMMATSSGSQVMSSIATGKGHGFHMVEDNEGFESNYHGDHNQGGAWARQLTQDPRRVHSIAFVEGQGEVQAIGCNDPHWCDDLWYSGQFQQN